MKKSATGDFSRRALLNYYLPLFFGLYYLSMFITGMLFPTPYDWRLMPISDLFDVGLNPNGWFIYWRCLIPFGVLHIPLAGYWYRKLQVIGKRTAASGSILFSLAGVGWILLGTFPNVPTNLTIHMISAGVAAIGYYFALLCFWVIMMKDRLAKYNGKRQFNFRLMNLGTILAWFSIIGMVSYYLIVPSAQVEFIEGADLLAQGYSAIYSFSLWEWIMYTQFNINIVLLAGMIPETIEPL
ncbi:MAG TPA: hypothetical protein VKK79_24960 [Candidatus Lokiarchaeia archaeon]|nr:hypothetical protein [Candidatus Lokiarchaeia archaeon]